MDRVCSILLLVGGLLAACAPAAPSQTPPKHEFRGAWMATTYNLDWPSSRTARPATQKAELRRLLDSLEAAGINAVFFQVRSASDAMYASDLEPWSYWLTGTQGQAPDPYYDPLRFAVREAHERGMELHAWFNPFRAVNPGSDYALAPSHVAKEHPEWLLAFDDGLKILDPGLPQVRRYVTRVVTDVARRYAVDGVHFDDFFYPYPPRHMDQPGNRDKDRDTFRRYSRGFEDIEDWRRDNINRFVQRIHDSLRAVAPRVVFGISPFGIWKDGVPDGITGLSAYHTIYADARAWLRTRSVDYLAPQLYWGFGGGQDYATLAPWWGARAANNGRHLYPGLAAYKAAPETAPGTALFTMAIAMQKGRDAYGPSVVPRQIRYNRRRASIQGSVFFRTENLTRLSSKGLADSLRNHLYRTPALPPTMPWRRTTPPESPKNLTVERTGTKGAQVVLRWEPPSDRTPPVRHYAVYRIRSKTAPDFSDAPRRASALLAVTGRTAMTDRPLQAPAPYHYAVTAVSPNSVESTPSGAVEVEGRARPAISGFVLRGNAPNPFSGHTRIIVGLPVAADVTVTVYDVLGRRVARTRSVLPAGRARTLQLEATGLSSGVYLYRVTAATENGVQPVGTDRMVVAR